MTESVLRDFRPVARREVASLSARYITSVVIGMAGLLLIATFLPLATH